MSFLLIGMGMICTLYIIVPLQNRHMLLGNRKAFTNLHILHIGMGIGFALALVIAYAKAVS